MATRMTEPMKCGRYTIDCTVRRIVSFISEFSSSARAIGAGKKNTI